MKHTRVLIEHAEGISIYGRVINATGRMGLYEVFSDYWGWNREVYHLYADAERRRDFLIDLHKRKRA